MFIITILKETKNVMTFLIRYIMREQNEEEMLYSVAGGGFKVLNPYLDLEIQFCNSLVIGYTIILVN